MNDHKNSPVFRPEAGHQARDLVKRAFEAAGWNAAVEPRRADRMRPDFLLSHGPYQYVAEVKAIPRGSSVPLEDSWSRACLQAQRYANNNARPLAIVVAPKISPKAFERLAMFADQYAPDVAMGVMDHLGLQMFRGPGLEALNREPQMASSQHDARRLVSKNLFSNLNQWLLKVLLAPEIPERLMGAPRQDCRSASALAAAAECSVMSAHRFVDDLRREGFLDESARHLRIVRRAELFRRWQSVPSQSVPDIAYKLVVQKEIRSQLPELFPPQHACLGLFAAAEELGMGFVRGVPPYVLVDQPSMLPGGADASSGANNMMHAGPGDPVHLIVRIPKAPRSVFGGVVRSNNVASADIIQVWLDVSEHPARGREQAQFIWDNSLSALVGSSLA